MGTGYTRQSAAEIVDGQEIIAEPLNREFNAVRNAFHESTGHAHDGTSGEGPKLDLSVSITGVLQPSQGGTGGVHKLDATAAPTVNDDASAGYRVGSLWVNTTTDKYWVCVDSTNGAAVWLGEQALDADLVALAALASTGHVVRTAANTYALRTIAGTSPVSVTNGDGIAGNPTIAVSAASTTADGLMSSTDKVKLNGIASGATANSSDATLLSRANHTGTQTLSTISDAQAALDEKLDIDDLEDAVSDILTGSTNKDTPVDNDYVIALNSADSYSLIHITWSKIKATLKTYFDTIYAATSHSHSNATTSADGFMSKEDKATLDGIGTNAEGNRTISTSAPTGGSNGDIWLQV